jgi:predicted anti-sigma-YlaC factor YlaD
MTCEKGDARLSGYLDGELSAREASDVRAHLEECAECRAMVSGLEGVRAWAASYKPAGSEEGWADLQDRMRGSPREERERRGVGTRFFLAAALVVLTAGGGVLWTAFVRGVPGVPVTVSLDAEIAALELVLAERGPLSIALQDDLDEGLGALEEHLALLNEDLARTPDSEVLRELSRRSRQQKRTLLQNVITLSESDSDR